MSLLRSGLLAALLLLVAAASASAQGQNRIVGGGPAPNTGEYDAVANVSIAGALGCTGTLIAPDWVLTAGHCGSVTGAAVGTPVGFPVGAITVTLGTTAADGTGGTDYTVLETLVPTEYLNTQGYDISLLHLIEEVPASVAVPVPVAGLGFEPLWADRTLQTIAGFGTTSSGGDAPDTMKVAQVPVIPDPDCAAAYDTYEDVTQLCAGYPGGGTDSCQGDSGGPMFGATDAGLRLVVGATSYGTGCADAEFPGVYARVADAELREWIREYVPAGVRDRTSCESATPKQVYDPAKNATGPDGATTPGVPVPTTACPVNAPATTGGGTTDGTTAGGGGGGSPTSGGTDTASGGTPAGGLPGSVTGALPAGTPAPAATGKAARPPARSARPWPSTGRSAGPPRAAASASASAARPPAAPPRSCSSTRRPRSAWA